MLPVLVFTGQIHTLGRGTRGNDDSITCIRRLLFTLITFTPQLERSLLTVELADRFSFNSCAESFRLCPHLIHERTTQNTFRETREILDIGRGCKLSTRSKAIGHHAFKECGVQVGSCEIDSSCMACIENKTTSMDTPPCIKWSTILPAGPEPMTMTLWCFGAIAKRVVEKCATWRERVGRKAAARAIFVNSIWRIGESGWQQGIIALAASYPTFGQPRMTLFY